ncbi:polysaccharide deacetylase family protein [Ruminococcus sp. 210702-SL.1.03]|uniref:polysaccharide deacetylase family protein n=1 Tax=Ruminococcus sp. 210702-SL.1.03 TaxID=2883233 RepID=UPI001D072B80|nr:polysaccharide deacetylase family protein [Ruminococcus sp. 210702-SL.1.03]MCB6615657.1 polysaccharide deacetylase family protein [Ruminococcus sp. 210702-SL.1.03]
MKQKICLLMTAAAMLAAGCAAADNDTADRSGNTAESTYAAKKTARTTMDSTAVEPVQGGALSTEKHGYGQGVQLDDKNRPTGALDFNANYGKYGAEALREDKKNILLTFDQGYENGYTAQILDTLKEKKVKAVFFLLQDYAERNPELVQRMIDEGHIVGNHSVSHYSMPDLSAEECRQEIEGLQEYMKQNFGVTMKLFRPPMGEFSEQSLSVTKDCGLSTMLWSFAYADWDVNAQPDPAQAKEKLIGAAHEGAVYLLHSVSQTNAEVLSEVIDGIRDEGFEFEKLK